MREACGDPTPQHRLPVAGCDTAAGSASGSGTPAEAFAHSSAEPLQGSGGGSVFGAIQPASHHFDYSGSRRRRARYECGGFIELSPAASAGEPEMVVTAFRQSLTAVPGVDRVDLHPKGSKTHQGNLGNHYQDHSFAVFSLKNPKVFIEFELTRHQHINEKPFTVTARYKNPIKALIPEAWRILRIACQGKELLPDWVNEMDMKLLGHQWPGSASPEEKSNTVPVLDDSFLDDDTKQIQRLMMETADPLPIPHGDSFRWQGDPHVPVDPVDGAAPSSLSKHGKQMRYDMGDGDLGALPAPDDESSDPDSPITAGPYPGSSASTAVGVLLPQQAYDNLVQFLYALEHGLDLPPPVYEIPDIIDDEEDTTDCYPPCRHRCEQCGPLHQCTYIDGRPDEELTESDESDFGMIGSEPGFSLTGPVGPVVFGSEPPPVFGPEPPPGLIRRLRRQEVRVAARLASAAGCHPPCRGPM